MSGELFVPADFAVPDGLVADEGFRLAPLGPQHNEADYIYPLKDEEPGAGTEGVPGAAVRSWVRADRAQLDRVVHDAVLAWLERDWPFHSIEYASRA
jgi:hypothetical protein